MNERIYQSVRLQHWLLWTVTIAIPFVVALLFSGLISETSKFHMPLWIAILTGVAISLGVHLLLRRRFKLARLHGTAIYFMYQRERKMEAVAASDSAAVR